MEYMQNTDNGVAMVAEPAEASYGTHIGMRPLSISIPEKDLTLAQEMISRMGWMIIERPQMPASLPSHKTSVRKALNELRGCISLPKDFDYKESLYDALKEKYDRI